jgi:Recombinase zinc beta ribbon domain
LLGGLLVCSSCGSHCYVQGRGTTRAQYVCAARHRCLSDCAEPSISYRVADAAVLREVARLRRAPWQPHPLEAVAARDPHAQVRRRLRAEIADVSAEMDAHVRSFSLANLAGQPTHEEILAFRRRSQKISARITRAKDELEALPEVRANTLTAQQVHALLAPAHGAKWVYLSASPSDRRARSKVRAYASGCGLSC